MNRFIFRPVGQGLFYTGALHGGDFNFVYDCGAWDLKVPFYEAYVKEQVDKYVSELGDKEIDFVVISHMHLDHFNGLYHLAKQKVIKKLYIPYLGGNDFNNLLMLIGILGKDVVSAEDFELLDFIVRLYVRNIDGKSLYGERDERVFENIKKAIVIGEYDDLPYSDDRRTERNEQYDYYSFNEKRYFGNKMYWEFKFCNKALSRTVIARLRSEIIKELSLNDVNDLYHYIISDKKAINKIARIYSKNIKQISPNATSIVLYHYPLYNSKMCPVHYHSKYFCEHCCCQKLSCAAGNDRLTTLLTGDAEFDITMVNRLNNGNSYIDAAVFQVPHHGAYHNAKLANACNIKADNYIVPFGLGNSHKHPDATTIKLFGKDNIFSATDIHEVRYYIW